MSTLGSSLPRAPLAHSAAAVLVPGPERVLARGQPPAWAWAWLAPGQGQGQVQVQALALALALAVARPFVRPARVPAAARVVCAGCDGY